MFTEILDESSMVPVGKIMDTIIYLPCLKINIVVIHVFKRYRALLSSSRNFIDNCPRFHSYGLLRFVFDFRDRLDKFWNSSHNRAQQEMTIILVYGIMYAHFRIIAKYKKYEMIITE